jgi:hypothetical protein
MIGMAIARVFDSSESIQWPFALLLLFLLLVLYYILDWLSYNAIMDIDNKLLHREVFAYIVSIVTLGGLLVLSTHLINPDGALPSPSSKSVCIFIGFLGSYIFLTSAVGYVLFYMDIKKQLQAHKGVSEGTANNFLWHWIDVGTRILAVIIIARRIGTTTPQMDDLLMEFVVVVALLVIGKAIRYEFLLLPLAKEKLTPSSKEQNSTSGKA